MARPSDGKSRRGGKKNRKHGRNKRGCERYRAEGRRERNKAVRLARHVRRQPHDTQARAALLKMRSN